ncbi:MAG: hypothetical protein ABII06_15595 [Pseudomonadota bacterium]
MKKRFGFVAIEKGFVTPDQVIEALSIQAGENIEGKQYRCIGEILFSLGYIGISSSSPYFGFILSFPDTIQVKEKRREERFYHDMPDFISAEFSLGNGLIKDKLYHLNIINCSKYGINSPEIIESCEPEKLK